jgi:hypothetical protein
MWHEMATVCRGLASTRYPGLFILACFCELAAPLSIPRQVCHGVRYWAFRSAFDIILKMPPPQKCEIIRKQPKQSEIMRAIACFRPLFEGFCPAVFSVAYRFKAGHLVPRFRCSAPRTPDSALQLHPPVLSSGVGHRLSNTLVRNYCLRQGERIEKSPVKSVLILSCCEVCPDTPDPEFKFID